MGINTGDSYFIFSLRKKQLIEIQSNTIGRLFTVDIEILIFMYT